MTDNHKLRVLRMTAYPPGNGPYDRWELTVEETGELLASGLMPIDLDKARAAVEIYHSRLDREIAHA